MHKNLQKFFARHAAARSSLSQENFNEFVELTAFGGFASFLFTKI